jgi:hypothetical protein
MVDPAAIKNIDASAATTMLIRSKRMPCGNLEESLDLRVWRSG